MTYPDLKEELKSRLSAEGSTFYTDTKLGEWINLGYKWLGGLKNWPVLETAKKTTSIVKPDFKYDIYNYPSDFRTDSLVRLAVDDELWGEKDTDGNIKQGKLAFDDFLSFIENNPSSEEKFWSDWGRQYFIFPKLTAGRVISVWGHIYPPKLSDPTDLTVFEGEPELEEAIIKKAHSIALIKGKRKREGQAEEAEAINLANIIWDKIMKRQASYLRKDKPFLDVPDFFK
jgi:hypothetical protein